MKPRFVLIGVATFWTVACLVSMLRSTGGALSMPLDDAFIFFQYARRFVEGAPLTYQTGDPATAGATSLLTVLVDAVGYLAGFRGEAMIVFVLLTGAAAFAWSAGSALAIGRRLVPEAPWIAPALLLASGPLIWGFASGMDLPWFVALSLAWAARWPEPGARPGRAFYVLGALLGLARPDALFLVLPAFLFGITRARSAWWALPLGATAFPFLLQFLLTGRAPSASMEVKSILSRPDLSFGQWIVEGSSYLAYVVKGVLGGGEVESAARVAANDASGTALYVVPFALGLLVLGLLPGAWIEARERRPGLHALLLAWIILLVGAQAFTVPRNWHWNRYLMPVYALAFPGIAGGIARAGRLVETAWADLRPGDGARLLAGLALVLSLPGAAYFTVAYGRNAADIRFQHIELARRLNALPEVGTSTLVAVHDVGALKYFGEYRVRDVEGLADPRFRVAGRLGSAGIWETMERTPPSARPGLLAVYASWFDPAFLAPHRLLFAQRQFRPSIAAGNPLQVHAADWSLAGNGDLPCDPAVRSALAGWALVGEVDVADFESERAANYRLRILDGAYDNALRALPAGDGTAVMEGGRLVSGSESFALEGVVPGGEIALVARTAGPARIRVRAGGRDAGVWSMNGVEKGWEETVFRVPAPPLEGGRLRVTLASDDPHHAAYAAYHYWVYQRRS